MMEHLSIFTKIGMNFNELARDVQDVSRAIEKLWCWPVIVVI